MSDQEQSVLQHLRSQILDPTVSTTDLLRTALLLGADAGSTALKDWARCELTGYPDQTDLPNYRQVPAGITCDAVNPRMYMTGQRINALELPHEAEVTNEVSLRQPLRELEHLAASSTTVRFSSPSLDYARILINQQNTLQQVTSITYVLASASITGVIDQVRTTLVELVGELGTGPLPTPTSTDHAVHTIIHKQEITMGDTYEMTANHNQGAIAQGAHVQQATTIGAPQQQLQQAFDDLRAAITTINDDTDRETLEQATTDLENDITTGNDTTRLERRANILTALATSVATPAVTESVKALLHHLGLS